MFAPTVSPKKAQMDVPFCVTLMAPNVPQTIFVIWDLYPTKISVVPGNPQIRRRARACRPRRASPVPWDLSHRSGGITKFHRWPANPSPLMAEKETKIISSPKQIARQLVRVRSFQDQVIGNFIGEGVGDGICHSVKVFIVLNEAKGVSGFLI